MWKNRAIIAPVAAGGVMGVFVNLLPDGWGLGRVMVVTLPVALIVGIGVGRLVAHFLKK